MNLFSLAKEFPTEEAALEYWIRARWPNGVRCLACDHEKVYRIETKGKTGKPCLLFECADCGLHFSPTTDTLFHDSHLPMRKWFAAIALMVEAKKGISASQLKRHLGVTYKTAWFLAHRIRQAMQEDSNFKVGGPTTPVELDEMYVGGRKRLQGVKAGKNAKSTVLGLAERDGQIHMQTIPNGGLVPLRDVYKTRIESDTREVVTDDNHIYQGVIPRIKHIRGNHKEELKSKNWTSTYTVESAFSLFKRGIVGNYHKLGEEHLDRYLGEFCWRYNRRNLQPQMFDLALKNLTDGKPLPYKTLIRDDF